jgi:uncharacterized protein YukE
MARLQVSYDEMKDAAQTCRTQADAVQQAIDAVKTKFDTIQAYLEATFEQTFMDEWSATMAKGGQLPEMLRQHGQALDMIVTKLQTAEDEAKSSINSTISSN